MVKADFLTGITLILMSLYVMVESWRMPRFEHLQAHPLSAPGLVPAFLSAIIALFGMVLIVRSIKRGGHHLRLTRGALRRVFGEPGHQRLLVTAVLAIGYAGFLIGRISYWLATCLFVFLFVAIFEWKQGMPAVQRVKHILIAVILAVTTAAGVTIAFERLFLVTLP